MMLSMTGFASKTIMVEHQNAHAQLTIIIKSLNSRFFETTCKLPFALTHLETEFIKLFKHHLRRGNITFTIQISNQNFFKGSVQADLAIAKSYAHACKKIQDALSMTGNLEIDDLVMLPNIFSLEEHLINESMQKTIINAVQDTLQQLIKTRIAEGKQLQEDIMKRLDILHQELEEIKNVSAQAMEHKKKDIAHKISALESTGELAESQRALYYLELDKADIHEETTRFKGHLDTLEKCIHAADEEKGRRLDFILQELGREINTIAAKSGDARLSALAINIKVELEKIREQVQNIV